MSHPHPLYCVPGLIQCLVKDAASHDELWAALTPAERETFTKALRDPNSELAQQLLSEEIEKVRIQPWWEAPAEDTNEEDPGASWRAQKRYGKKPAMMQVPVHMARMPPTPGKLPLLLYNFCALMYVFSAVVWLPVSYLYSGLRMRMLHGTSRPRH